MVDPIKPIVRERKETSRIWVILSVVLFFTTLAGAVIIFVFGMPFESPEPSVAILEDLAQMEAELEMLAGDAMMEEGDAPNGFYDASPEFTFEYPSSHTLVLLEINGYTDAKMEFFAPQGDISPEFPVSTTVVLDTRYVLSGIDGGVTFSELEAFWDAAEVSEVPGPGVVEGIETGILDGRRYVKIIEFDETITRRARLYIEGSEPATAMLMQYIYNDGYPVADLAVATILETIDFDPEPEDVEEAE